MLKLIQPSVVPPKGFFFEDPDTGFKYDRNYRSFHEMARHVSEYRTQNGLPNIENFRATWEAWRCQFDDMKGRCCPVEAHVRRTFSQYVKGAIAYWKLRGSKRKLVTPELAEKRALVCAQCQFNVKNIGHNHSQFYTDKFIEGQIGPGRRTSVDARLFTCKLCTCLLRSKVHLVNSIVAGNLSQREQRRLQIEPRSISGKAIRCWQLDALEGVKNGIEGDEDGKEKGYEEGQGEEGREEGREEERQVLSPEPPQNEGTD